MIEQELRDRILSEPEKFLEDRAVMNALVAANERAMGANIVDLRSIAMQRLEARLDRLEDTHRSVIAAAYENLAGTNQIHRAILALLDPLTFGEFLQILGGEVAQILRVDNIRLVLESEKGTADETLQRLHEVLHVAGTGFVASYISNGKNVPLRPVVLRPVVQGLAAIHGKRADAVRSEALMRLDFGQDRLPGMLVMGSEDPHQFKATQGTDLLAFFAGVFERTMRRWLG
ncbi:MAG: DUF484 family protein [Tabrizicola sp.]|nr:DUF484 family protein [Tabrizicola sp.]